MASANTPNIDQLGIERLWLDQNDAIVFIFTQDGTPMDITSRNYKLVFYETVPTVALTIQGNRLVKDNTATEKLTYLPSSADRTTLIRGKSYVCVLFELVSDGASGTLDDYLGHFSFKWLDAPGSFDAGKPRTPLPIQINYVSATGQTLLYPVYEGFFSIGAYESLSAAQAAQLPGQMSHRLVVVDDLYLYVKAATYMIPLQVGEKILNP